jgi:ribose transport system substrate-binding protein
MSRSNRFLKSAIAGGVAACAFAAMAAASDTRVALVPGGPHPYFAAWEQAGQDAVQKFGLAAADYRVPQKWELTQQNQLLESLLSQGYNGFLIFPGDPVGTNSIVSELTAEGAPVISLAGCLKQPSEDLFCLGTDVGKSAYLGTQELIKAMGGKGRIAHFTGFLVDPNTQLRMDAVKKAVDEMNGAVELVQVIADIDAPEPAEEKINAFLAAEGQNVDGIVTTAWVPSVVAANALRRIGDKRIKMVGIDHDEAVLNAIKDGFVHGTMLQNPYGQGYIGSYAIDRIRSGCKVKEGAPFASTALTDRFIDSGTAFVGPDKVDTHIEAMQAVTEQLMSNFEQTYLDCQS